MADKKPAGKQKKKLSSRKYKNYQVSGSTLTRKNKFCPKCGAGFFMAQHSDRLTCGKCSYTEFLKK
jgi:small subunit ribosomal protein S27Ae